MTIVHKFGGTSLGRADRFDRVADIILDQHRRFDHHYHRRCHCHHPRGGAYRGAQQKEQERELRRNKE
jgi:hypothetical protein